MFIAGIISLLDEDEPKLKVHESLFKLLFVSGCFQNAWKLDFCQLITILLSCSQEFALHKLNAIVNDFWAEISESVDKM